MAGRLCPVWVGYLLINPLRSLVQNPGKILRHYVKEGMKVLDIGCGMGFFSLPLARMVQKHGKVICIDVQEKMLKTLERRAEKAGLINSLETRICFGNSLELDDLNEEVDFALAFAVVHEVPDVKQFFSDVYKTLKIAGMFFVAEPKGHVSQNNFEKAVLIAKKEGFTVLSSPHIWRSHTVLLKKK
jgi:ubiquinone/menaquinone biosynthesis C-methylase UbiE